MGLRIIDTEHLNLDIKAITPEIKQRDKRNFQRSGYSKSASRKTRKIEQESIGTNIGKIF